MHKICHCRACLNLLIKEFKALDNSAIDPTDNIDWHDLCLGWLIGKGYDLSVVHSLALEITYHN